MFTSKTHQFEGDAFALPRNQSQAAKKTLVAKSDSSLAAEGAFRRARMREVIREVFSSLALDAVHSSRRLPGSAVTVAGKSDRAVPAVNYRLLETAFSKLELRGERRHKGTWK